MDNDEAFLRAVAHNPADDALRLRYADWLDERADSRAEFLRVESALRKPPNDRAAYCELCKQEQRLVRKLDPSWLQRVRRFTTAPPCRDITSLVPDLIPFARTTTRLHPHRAMALLPLWTSKIGGRFLWPATEPWPSCAQCHVALTPVLQLRHIDVADIAFPAGTDLLQLFWCPDEPAHGYIPAARVWWRSAASVTNFRTDAPDLSAFPRQSDWEGYIPFECAVYPERVTEYPIGDDLYLLAGPDEAARIGALVRKMEFGPAADLEERFASQYGPSDADSLAFYELGQCPGSKVGGKPGFVKEGRQFDHLVTLSTWEVDSASFRRWLAVEDQRLLAPPGEPLTWAVRVLRQSAYKPLQEVLGMQLGRTQSAHLYLCREDTWDIHADVAQ